MSPYRLEQPKQTNVSLTPIGNMAGHYFIRHPSLCLPANLYIGHWLDIETGRCKGEKYLVQWS